MHSKHKKCCRRLSGSFSVEAALVFAVVFFAIQTMILYAFRERNLTLGGFLLSESAIRAARLEKIYDPENADPDALQDRLSKRLSSIAPLSESALSVKRGLLEGSASMDAGTLSLSEKRRIFNPEATLRKYTSLAEFAEKNKYRKGGAKSAENPE